MVPPGDKVTSMEADEELIQLAERQLAAAEEAYRVDPSDANRRRIMRAWTAVRRVRGEEQTSPLNPLAPPGS
jgi:hypothetical protein